MGEGGAKGTTDFAIFSSPGVFYSRVFITSTSPATTETPPQLIVTIRYNNVSVFFFFLRKSRRYVYRSGNNYYYYKLSSRSYKILLYTAPGRKKTVRRGSLLQIIIWWRPLEYYNRNRYWDEVNGNFLFD